MSNLPGTKPVHSSMYCTYTESIELRDYKCLIDSHFLGTKTLLSLRYTSVPFRTVIGLATTFGYTLHGKRGLRQLWYISVAMMSPFNMAGLLRYPQIDCSIPC